MKLSMSAEAYYSSHKPLDVLSELIQKRMNILCETAKDAAVATMITALKSVRALTRRAKKPANLFSVVEMSDLTPSYRSVNGSHHPRLCARCGGPKGPRVDLKYPIRLAWPGIDIRHCKTFFIRPTGARDQNRSVARPYFIFAYNQNDAAQIQLARERRRFERNAGLARFAEGVAMAALSTRNGNSEHVRSSAARAFARQCVSIASSQSRNEKSLEVRDSIPYALLAVKGGASGVDIALRKASNAIAGMLRKFLDRHPSFSDRPPTPFPEVARNRGAA